MSIIEKALEEMNTYMEENNIAPFTGISYSDTKLFTAQEFEELSDEEYMRLKIVVLGYFNLFMNTAKDEETKNELARKLLDTLEQFRKVDRSRK